MRYWIAFAVCGIAATAPLLMTGVLPCSDLPEHMAQVSIWKHFHDACPRYSEIFELHFATPYLLGYVITRALAMLMTVTAATKVVVWLSIVLLPLSLRALCLRGGSDVWLSLLGFPLAFGYSFYWGFLNFALATPLAIFAIALLFDKRPVWRAIAGVLLMASHALLFAFVAAVTIAVAIARRSARLLLPLIPGAMLLIAFAAERDLKQETTWKLGLSRFVDFPSLLFANAWEPWGLVLLAAMIVAVIVARPRFTRDRARWAFAIVAALAYLVMPFGMSGTAYLYPRFALLLAVALLFLFDTTTHRARVLIVMIAIAWMAVLTVRFRRFGSEARELEVIVAQIPAARRVAQFNADAFSEHVPGPVFWHAGALYVAERGGISAWSFSSREHWYPSIVRFRRGAEPVIRSRTTPVNGIDWPGVLQYDYLLLRGSDPRRTAFRDAPVPLALRARSGNWWLFETPRARTPQRDCAPLNE